MPGLVLEGGTFRPIFSCGVMDALLDEGIMFPYCIGVSAGISDGVSYISRQRGRNIEIAMKYRNDKRYIGVSNLRKYKSIFGLDFVFGEIPESLVPFDWDAYHSYQGRVVVGVTNIETGQAEYMDGLKADRKFMMLRATCAMPLVFPPIEIDGRYYYDGGVSDPIPVRKAVEDGNSRNLIILTRPEGYRKELGRSTALTAKHFARKYPRLGEVLLSRHIRYNETVAYCEQLEKEGKAVLIRPEGNIDSFEKDTNQLKKYYDQGYKLMQEKKEAILSLFE